MADFTGGVIDLSVANTFDNIILGASDTMTFSNSGTGGGSGKPIKVLGNFTTAVGSVINLRNNVNLTPGSVTSYGITRDLDVANIVNGTAGTGGSRGWCNTSCGCGGSGSAGGVADTNDGKANAGGSAYSTTNCSGFCSGSWAGGTSTQSYGDNGQSGSDNRSCNNNQNFGSGGQGGAAGEPGKSCESVMFEVAGNVDLKGTINGAGTDAGNAGNGGRGGNGDYAGGGGGGGAGSGGGHGGNLYVVSPGTRAETLTKNLSGGAKGSAGTGGAGGTDIGGVNSSENHPGVAGGAGTQGDDGITGTVELINADGPPEMGTSSVTDIFARQVVAHGEVTSAAGNTITERGFVIGKNINPTI